MRVNVPKHTLYATRDLCDFISLGDFIMNELHFPDGVDLSRPIIHSAVRAAFISVLDGADSQVLGITVGLQHYRPGRLAAAAR